MRKRFFCSNAARCRGLEAAVQELEKRAASTSAYANLLRQCAECRSLPHGKRVHAHIVSSGVLASEHLVKMLVHMYGHCGDLENARAVFDGFSAKDTVLWNTMICAYHRNGSSRQALDLFFEMDSPRDMITFMTVLRVCAVRGALDEGKAIHKQILSSNLSKAVRVQNSLISMYAKCGSLETARCIFDEVVEKRDVVTWNSIISAYAHFGHSQETLNLYRKMQLEGVRPDGITFSSLLGRCKCKEEVRCIHETVVVEMEFDVFVLNALISAYAKCDCVELGREVFDGMQKRDLVSWNSMIAAYAQKGHSNETLALLDRMDTEGVDPDDITLACALGACSQIGDVDLGRRIHQRVSKSRFKSSVIVETALVSMYCKCGAVDEAKRVFDSIRVGKDEKQQSVSPWNAMIAGYVQQGRAGEAIELFQSMSRESRSCVQPDRITFTSVLGACCCLEDLDQGSKIHSLVAARGLDKDEVVETTLFNMYARCGQLSTARTMFDGMQRRRSVVSWNAMIAAYAQSGDLLHARDGVELYGRMDAEGVGPDEITFIHALSLCSTLKALEEGRGVHDRVVKSGCTVGVVLGTAVVNMYGKCNAMVDARREFDRVKEKTVVTWNALIAAYSQHGHCKMAIELFEEMNLDGTRADGSTFVSVLSALSGREFLRKGREVHRLVVEGGYSVLETPLFNMYAKCGELEIARCMFDRLRKKSVVSWNAMITAYAHDGRGKEAIQLYELMKLSVQADSITFASLLTACSSSGGWHKGMEIHQEIRDRGLHSDVVLETAIVNMYGKCGNVGAARKAFDEMETKNAVTWAAMITVYVQQGYDRESLELLARMDSEGVQPNRVILAGALAACSRLEALSEGKLIHSGLDTVPPALESGLINLYAKCGKLDVARGLFDDRSEKLDPVAWNSMIAGYVQEGFVEVALDLYKEMRLEGVEANVVTFSCVISGCSQAGMLSAGRDCFLSMIEHGVEPEADHFVSMVDLLARAGRIQSAEELLESMPFEPYALAWSTLLGSCRMQGDSQRGRKFASNALELDPKNTAPYVLVYNIMKGSLS